MRLGYSGSLLAVCALLSLVLPPVVAGQVRTKQMFPKAGPPEIEDYCVFKSTPRFLECTGECRRAYGNAWESDSGAKCSDKCFNRTNREVAQCMPEASRALSGRYLAAGAVNVPGYCAAIYEVQKSSLRTAGVPSVEVDEAYSRSVVDCEKKVARRVPGEADPLAPGADVLTGYASCREARDDREAAVSRTLNAPLKCGEIEEPVGFVCGQRSFLPCFDRDAKPVQGAEDARICFEESQRSTVRQRLSRRGADVQCRITRLDDNVITCELMSIGRSLPKELYIKNHADDSADDTDSLRRVRPLAKISRNAVVRQTWLEVEGRTNWLPLEAVNTSTGRLGSGLVWFGGFRDFNEDSGIAELASGRYHLASDKRVIDGEPVRLPFRCYPACAYVETLTMSGVFESCRPYSATLVRFAGETIEPTKATVLRCGGPYGLKTFVAAEVAVSALRMISRAREQRR